MNIIQLGPLMVNFELLNFILSASIGYTALRYHWTKVAVEGAMNDKFVHALFLGFFTWKFSIIIVDPISVIRNPLSLLYYSGGQLGLWLAIASSIVFLWIRTWKDGTPIRMNVVVLVTAWLAGSSMYHLLSSIVIKENVLFHLLYIAVNIVFAVFVYSLLRRNGVLILVVLALVSWVIYDNTNDYLERQQALAGEGVGIKKGNKAPDFELLRVDGQPLKLSDFRGKKVILNFWATWCPPCRAEMPQMEKFYKDYNNDVVVLAVNLSYTEKNDEVVALFTEDYGLTFPVVKDARGHVASVYQVFAYPTSYIIDSQGFIQDVLEGAVHYDTLRKAVSRIH